MSNKSEKASDVYKTLIKNIPIGIYYTDFLGTFLFGNPKAEEITGYREDELVGKNYLKLKLLSPKDITKAAKNLALVGLGKLVDPVEYNLIRKDGKIRNVEITPKIITLEGKKVIMAMIQDITARKEAAAALLDSEAKYKAVIQQSEENIFVIDPDTGGILESNKSIQDLLGYSKKELGQLTLFDFVNHEKDDIRHKIENIIKKKKFAMRERQYKTKSGRIIDVEVNASLINFGGKDAIAVVSRDITEKKRAAELIKKSLIEKDMLLKEVYHRVKNNLQLISSLLRLQASSAKEKKTAIALNRAEERIRSMALIHQQLHTSEDLTKINFAEYFKKLSTYLRRSYQTLLPNVTFHNNLQDIYIDIKLAIPCGLIVNELITNSMKYAFPKRIAGEITVNMSHAENGLCTIIVSDNGIGIPEKIDFRNVQTLGLQLVNDLTAQLGGTIELDRTDGTAFTIKFQSKI